MGIAGFFAHSTVAVSGEEAVHWLLLTWLPVDTLTQPPRLEPLLAVFSRVAWKLLWLTYQRLHTPDAPCSLASLPHQWMG